MTLYLNSIQYFSNVLTQIKRDNLTVLSLQVPLVYEVAQPPCSSSSTPKPCSPQGQGICYLVPTSPEPAPEAAWQDFHNPGYRQSYIDSGV